MKKETWMGLFIAIIMISSMLAVMVTQNTNNPRIRYNEKVFIFEENSISTKINDEKIYFINSPENFNASFIPEELIKDLQNTAQIYFTLDENDTLIDEIEFYEKNIYATLFVTNNMNAKLGTTSNNSINMITCENATEFVPVIYVREYNNSDVIYENNCLIANVQSNSDIISLRDGILYKYYNIK